MTPDAVLLAFLALLWWADRERARVMADRAGERTRQAAAQAAQRKHELAMAKGAS
jgi:hypothetical protein